MLSLPSAQVLFIIIVGYILEAPQHYWGGPSDPRQYRFNSIYPQFIALNYQSDCLRHIIQATEKTKYCL